MRISGVDSGQSFDFGKTSEAYSKYRDIYPEMLYNKLKDLGVSADETSWLDLGTGTGVLPKNLYNPKCETIAVDISKEQIAKAEADSIANGRSIRYMVVPAESTDLPDSYFDTITAAQCFAYFDRQRIISEIKRMIKPGGKFIIIYLDWDYADEIFSESAATIKRFNPLWNPNNNGNKMMYEDILPCRKTEVYNVGISFTRESWHGRMCACRGTLASMDGETFLKWENAHKNFVKNLPEKFDIKHQLFITSFQL